MKALNAKTRSETMKTRMMKRPACSRKPGVRQNDSKRHRILPCCGTRPAHCLCDGGQFGSVKAHLNLEAYQSLTTQLDNSQLLSVKDTSDTSFFLDLHGSLPIHSILILALWFRHFGNMTLWAKFIQRGCLGVDRGREPDWALVEEVLTESWKARAVPGGDPVYSSLYRSRVLSEYCQPLMEGTDHAFGSQPAVFKKVENLYDNKKAISSTADRVKRDMVSMLSLYEAALHCAPACHGYSSHPCPATYEHLYDTIESQVGRRTKGIFGDYGLKLALDILICSGKVESAHITKWPMSCPGYEDTMKLVFPGLPKDKWFAAFLFLYREIGGIRKLKFPEVIMHLCWYKRRASGSLKDDIAPET